MSDRVEIKGNELENVTGGALKWIANGKIVYPLDNPNAVYHYVSYSQCQTAIREMGALAAQDESTLIALMERGLVYKA